MKKKFYYLAFILYLFFSFIGQFFILNRVFGEGVGTVFIGLLLFHWAFGIVSSTSCFWQQKGQESHKFYRFSILFLPMLYLVLSLLGGRTYRLYARLDCISFICGGLCRLDWNQIHDQRFLARLKAGAFFRCYHHFLEVRDICLGLFLVALKRSWKWIIQMTLQSLVWRENLL